MTVTDTTVDMRHIAVDDLTADPANLRQDLGNLDDLITSVQALGIIEPLVVTPELVVVAGHRRLAAAYEVGLTSVPCVVRQLDDTERAEIMLVENLAREGLNPIEEARGYERLVELGRSQRQIAERVGCNQSHVSKRLKLRTLPEQAQAMVVAGDLQVNDALELAKLVELDADSAAEWLAQPGWPGIAERIRRVEHDRQRAAAIAEGEASGLIDAREFTWEHKRELKLVTCEREQATHWLIGNLDVTWLRPYVDESGTDESTGPTPPRPKSEYELRHERETARSERRIETLTVALANGDNNLVDLGLDIGRRTFTQSQSTGREVFFEGLPTELTEAVSPSNAPLVVAVGMLWSALVSADGLAGPEDADEIDRQALLALVQLGYDLDADESAMLGDDQPAPEMKGAQAGDRVEDGGVMGTLVTCTACGGEPQDPTCSTCDGDGLLHEPDELPPTVEPSTVEPSDDADSIVDEDPEPSRADYDENTPPWKAYPFGRTEMLIKAIREHTDVDKLAHATMYELAHQGRPEVLEALAERRHELKAGVGA